MASGTPGQRGIGTVGIVFVVLLVLIAGIVAAVVVGPLGTPSVSGVSNHFSGVTVSETTVVSEVVVDNPNPVGLGTDDLTVAYAVDMNGIRMATGTKEGVSVGAGESTIDLTTGIHNGNISDWWVSHLQNGEQSGVVVHATVASGTLDRSFEAPKLRKEVTTDITSSFNTTERRPIEANQEPVVSDPVLYVEETSGWWGPVSEDETTVEMRFRVSNPKEYPISVQEVRYNVSMNDVHVGDGSTDRSYLIPPGETRTVAATLSLRNEAFDDWWVSHLQRNQVTKFAMELSMVVDLSEGGGPTVTVPLDTIEHTVETDVFGNKAQYPTGNATSDGNDEAGTATATDSDGATPTGEADDGSSTASPESSPTPTPTPTDDGVLDVSSERLRAIVTR
jgi:LEA14-like dessication related protein